MLRFYWRLVKRTPVLVWQASKGWTTFTAIVTFYLALSPYPKTVILKKMSWGNVVEWCVNRLKL